jgi:hypothetical protein
LTGADERVLEPAVPVGVASVVWLPIPSVVRGTPALPFVVGQVSDPKWVK